jgi:polyhydroxyalkanoate synthesis regulator phasin
MTDKPDIQPLINHLCQSGDLTLSQARRAVDEVIAYFSELPDDYVRRRHLEIKQEQSLANPVIFKRIEAELSQLVFAAPLLTQRQIRRIIYG